MDRKVQKIDASSKTAGRVASRIAVLLQGKHKSTYAPHIDCGDYVEVTNIKDLKFSGKKLDDKIYYRHSQYPGGLHSIQLKNMLAKNPAQVLRKMVYNMLPKNKLRARMLKRLTIS